MHISPALAQRRFTWRHDKVLRKLAHHVELKRVNANKSETKRSKNNGLEFVREGQITRKKSETKCKEHSISLLNRARDWELRVDLDKRLVFPFEIDTRLRPDMILYSTANKLLIIIELTVPWESRIDEDTFSPKC